MAQADPPTAQRARGPHRVWWLTGALAAAAAGLVPLLGWGPPLAEPHAPWWLLALAFVAAERCVVHAHFRRSSHSFSLGELPLVLGLLFASPAAVVLAVGLSSIPVMALARRQPAVKVTFNVAQHLLSAAVAVLAFRALAPAAGLGPVTWLAALAATAASGVVSVTAIGTAITLAEGGLTARAIARMLALDGAVGAANTSIALAAALVTSAQPYGLLLVLGPVGALYGAYRAFEAERGRQERLELLLDATQELSRSPEVADALEGVLSRSMAALQAAAGELVIFGGDGAPSLRSALGADGEHTPLGPADPALAADLRALLGQGRPVVLVDVAAAPPALRAHLAAGGVRTAMAAALSGDDGAVGALLLADRLGAVREFGAEDVRLFEALAAKASVALHNDRLEQAVDRLRTLQADLEHRAFHDALTELPNRALFHQRVESALASGRRDLAVLFCDLDGFKAVNDTMGHEAGDQLLVAVAGRLQAAVRPTDVVARLGGDEFALLIHDAGPEAAEAAAAAERILVALQAPVAVLDRTARVGTSVGLATPRPGEGAAELIRDADLAMYEAKQGGKNQLRVFESPMRRDERRRQGLREQLEQAIAREEFTLRYQPVVSLATGLLSGAEALVRWNHPQRGVVAPAEFIPLAEETGLIVAVGRLVLAQACRQVRVWEEHEPYLAPLSVHVNISSVELAHPEMGEHVAAALTGAGLEPSQLVLEVGEGLVAGQAEVSLDTLRDLRSLGVRLALDDFGAGPSSLTRLREMPLDVLKLGTPLVEGVARSDRHRRFVRAVIELARSLELGVIAEGIESAEQVEALRALDCELGQGYHLGRPHEDMRERPLPLAAAAGAWTP